MTWYPDMGNEAMVGLGEHVRAIGWLNPDHPYSHGKMSDEFVVRLREFARLANDSTMALYFGASAGVHACEFCGKAHDFRNFGVPSGDVLFVAPAMVAHYVEEHEYSPPPEFIAAVMASPLPNTLEYQVVVQPFREKQIQAVEEMFRKQRAQ